MMDALYCGEEGLRKLMLYVADKLDKAAVENLAYLGDVTIESGTTPLNVLKELRKKGRFCSANIQPLVELLDEINQQEVARYVEKNYQPCPPPILVPTEGQEKGVGLYCKIMIFSYFCRPGTQEINGANYFHAIATLTNDQGEEKT